MLELAEQLEMDEVKTYVYPLRVGRRQRGLIRKLGTRTIRLLLTRAALERKARAT